MKHDSVNEAAKSNESMRIGNEPKNTRFLPRQNLRNEKPVRYWTL